MQLILGGARWLFPKLVCRFDIAVLHLPCVWLVGWVFAFLGI